MNNSVLAIDLQSNHESALARLPVLSVRQRKRSHLKKTRARQAVLEVLRQSNDHPDADTIHGRARRIYPKISLASVYRALNAFLDQGLVERHMFRRQPAAWELARRHRHWHLIDVRSGAILDVEDADLMHAAQRVADALGYKLIDVKLELYAERLNAEPPRLQRSLAKEGDR